MFLLLSGRRASPRDIWADAIPSRGLSPNTRMAGSLSAAHGLDRSVPVCIHSPLTCTGALASHVGPGPGLSPPRTGNLPQCKTTGLHTGPSELLIVLTEFVTVEEISRSALSSKQSHSVPPSEMEAVVAITAERDSPRAGVSGAWWTPVLHQRGGPVERYQLPERLDDRCCH